MAKKLKPTLVLAGPGAGKTHHIINRVIEKIPLLSKEKYLAIITYTNTATLEIKERLSKEIEVPPNVFVGTIHSFLIRFFLKPFGKLHGYLPEEVIYKEIEITAEDKIEENRIKSNIVRKGIVPYDKIVSFSNNLIEDKEIRKLISNRIQFLFVDEFQDADSGQYRIFEQMRIAGLTEMYFVGDPEQSIMSFQNKGRKIPTMDKRAISKAINSSMINTEYLDGNHRSSKTIIDFINNFHSSIVQEHSNANNKTLNKVTFITEANDLREIIEQFNFLCNSSQYCEKRPKRRFFIAYEGDAYKEVENEFGLNRKEQKNSAHLNYIQESSKFICEILNKGKNTIINEMEIDNLTYRQLCIKTINSIRENPFMNSDKLINIIKFLFKFDPYKTVHTKIEHNPKTLAEDFIQKINFEMNYINNDDSEDYCLTIHKAKGQEADAVLMVAKTRNELKKWLEQDKDKRKMDKKDTCRIGYVGFSRAKEFLCIACLEGINDTLKKQLDDLNVELVSVTQSKTVGTGQ
ncbi:DNA helicase-2 / ATP-dependent DNA helicase PcrA [Salinibacillus kushneri]|uniref:DNA helicase-2 / ATP-dependent DNA helicase PcrA n=1 Tax=Salinibacillus kushneri TaxID=237682 RepID=A0A1I0A3U7_9BACI|nr:UvrD-helicase domain-containing protein [Salinibacillus kushneri]SES88799.1 DNA helicase-2 / ATP-dependent DNA helicase PcrA [Salinibacillus kushneri]